MREVVNLYSKFENLTEEKRKKIIDACVEEFSQNGYKNASTNSIVKNAQISKGILFHYFGNKKSLYLYVFDYIADFFTRRFYKAITDPPADIFERMVKMGIIKLKAAYEYPLEYKFLLDAVTHTSDELKQEIQARYEKMYKESMPIIFDNIDTSKFREGIDTTKAIEMIMYALEGLSNKYIDIFRNMPLDRIMSELEPLTQEFNQYIDILKNGVYK